MSFFSLLTYYLLLVSIASVAGNKGDNGAATHLIVLSMIFLFIETPDTFGFEDDLLKTKQPQSPHQKHKCWTVMSIFNDMGPHYVLSLIHI